MQQTTVTKDTELWGLVKGEFQKILTRDVFRNWFEPLQARMDDDGVLVIIAPTQFAAIWLEDNYLDVIREKVAFIGGEGIDIGIECSGEAALAEAPEPQAPKKPVSRLDQGRATSGRAGAGRTSSGRPKPFLNPRNTFESFVVGPSNQLAHAAATAVAVEPGKAYNPLFVYGDTGLGKTHLMHAVAHAIQANDPSAHVVYVSCEKFTNKFLQAIRENSLDEFRRFYRKVDVLLIDDIQFLEGKERTQEEFFHTFNELFESQRQLCLSSDRPASEISRLESRLVSRFQWGMVTDIQAPDLETRVAIMKKKAIAMGATNVSEEVLAFLASRITRNVRRLEGALIKVMTFARLVKAPLDVPAAERLIRDILQEESQQSVSFEKIQRKVVEYFDLRMSDMSSKRRPSNIAFPRQIAMYLCRILTNHPLKEIGEAFGGRDHGTVIHACKTVENIMEQDESVRRTIEYLTRQITGQLL
ncbi:MAG: chromosomal replication initiator protein DnaA [Opitutales bacterium]|nr:chromosomal replication initiator protein DnaA [Opitutales bacterium]